MGDEADRLHEMGVGEEANEYMQELDDDRDIRMRIKAKDLYEDATTAATGSTITCPSCGKAFTKNTYHNKFCSNQKTAGKNNCKDWYWNNVDDFRRERNRIR